MATRVPSPPDRRLAALETHLKLLRGALERIGSEPDLYKLLAAELRILVCEFGQNRPLLLDLMDQLALDYTIGPNPELPFPIALVDEEATRPPAGFEEWSPERIWEYHRSRGVHYDLRVYVRRALAVYILGEKYSYERLIRTLAEQSGVSHEDPTVDPNVLEMETIAIGGHISHTAPLLGLTNHVLVAGRNVVARAVALGYAPHYFLTNEAGVDYPPCGTLPK